MWPLIDQLVCQGVTDFFVAPGSRSTPLAIAAAKRGRLHRHFDERGLGFYALGYALAQEKPVAIIVTSGTAVGNLVPAVMEAHHASVPLIVITADRPAELQECSANQTTSQTNIFRDFVRWQFSFEPTMPEAAVRSQAAHAVMRAKNGPVHLNCHCREPLYPAASGSVGKQIALDLGRMCSVAAHTVPAHGVIVLGRLPKRSDVKDVLSLGERLGWPVLADVLSNARTEAKGSQIRHFDWITEMPEVEAVLHFGERMVSKRLKLQTKMYTHISPHTHWNDPSHLITSRVVSEIPEFCNLVTGAKDPEWLSQWQTLDAEAASRLDLAFENAPFTESSALRALHNLSGHAVFLGNSMPIREADWFLFPENAKGFFCNRGLSGIDGNVATAVGLAEGSGKPVIAVLGDLTTLHDLNSLALLRHASVPVKLVVSNNDGGGIFSHLAVAEDPEFEKLWGFGHGLGFEHAAKMFGIGYVRVDSVNELVAAMQTAGTCVVEMITSRKENALFHKHLKEAVISHLFA